MKTWRLAVKLPEIYFNAWSMWLGSLLWRLKNLKNLRSLSLEPDWIDIADIFKADTTTPVPLFVSRQLCAVSLTNLPSKECDLSKIFAWNRFLAEQRQVSLILAAIHCETKSAHPDAHDSASLKWDIYWMQTYPLVWHMFCPSSSPRMVLLLLFRPSP